jgi:hypothetical protein
VIRHNRTGEPARARSIRRVAIPLLAGVALIGASASASWSRTATTSATGTLNSVGTNSYTLVVQNTGDQAINCLQFTVAPGVTFVALRSTLSGTTVIPGRGFSFAAPSSDGAPISLNIQPGSGINFAFTTAAPYPSNAGGTLTVSPDCTQFVSATVTGPVAPVAQHTTSTNPLFSEKCGCMKLSLSISPRNLYTTAAQLAPEHDQLTQVGALVEWTMTCTATGSGGCTGTIAPLAPSKTDVDVSVFKPATIVPANGPEKGHKLFRAGGKAALTFSCAGPCDKTRSGSFFLRLDSKHDLGPTHRGNRGFVLRYKITCQFGSKPEEDMVLAFNSDGTVNRAQSILSG